MKQGKKTSMVRESSDYDDFYIISRDDAKRQLDDAEIFYREIEKYVLVKIKETLEE